MKKKIHQNDVNKKRCRLNFHSLNKDYVLYGAESVVWARISYDIWQKWTISKQTLNHPKLLFKKERPYLEEANDLQWRNINKIHISK